MALLIHSDRFNVCWFHSDIRNVFFLLTGFVFFAFECRPFTSLSESALCGDKGALSTRSRGDESSVFEARSSGLYLLWSPLEHLPLCESHLFFFSSSFFFPPQLRRLQSRLQRSPSAVMMRKETSVNCLKISLHWLEAVCTSHVATGDELFALVSISCMTPTCRRRGSEGTRASSSSFLYNSNSAIMNEEALSRSQFLGLWHQFDDHNLFCYLKYMTWYSWSPCDEISCSIKQEDGHGLHAHGYH